MKPEVSGSGGASLYRVREFQLDPAWYKARYPQAMLAVRSGEFSSLADYHANRGERELNSPSPLFAARYYAELSDYRQRAPSWGLVEDYLRVGAHEGVSPHWLFDEEFFQSEWPTVRAAVEARTLDGSYIYYLRIGSQKELRPHPLYCQWRVAQLLETVGPKERFAEFVRTIHAQGISPGPLFDPQWYVGRYPELASVGPGQPCESLLEHFCHHGIREGRIPLPDLDVDHYIRACLKANALGSGKDFNAVRHFLRHGVKAGIDPNRFFQSAYYLERNPEVAAEIRLHGFLGPFEHFMAMGLARNLRAAPPLVQLAVDDDSAKSLYEKRARLAADGLRRGARLQLELPAQPVLSAIVPVHNNFEYTAWLLRQLRTAQKCNPQLRLEVIVVDNGSTDLTRRLPQLVDGVKYLRLEDAVGYPLACNAGAKAAAGDLLVFLNNDIELVEGCFEAVARTLADETIGAVGGRIIKLNGVLQEAGGLVWSDGSAAGFGRGADPLAARFMVPRDVDYCSGCFLGVRRSVFEQLGGFEEAFSPGYYEETDLCARIWAQGLRVRYEPDVAIHHYEYASFSKGRPETISTALMARNRNLFAQRNAAFLRTLPLPDHARIDSHAFRRGGRPRHAVLVEDLVPAPELGSGFVRSRAIVDELLAQGWWVTLWVLHRREGVEPYNSGRCETVFAADHAGGLEHYLDVSGGNVDVVWICRTHNFRRLAPIAAKWRAQHEHRRIVCDTEAIASVRSWITGELAQGDAVDVSRVAERVNAASVSAELAGVEHADSVVLVNEIDRQIAQRLVRAPTFVLGHRFDLAPTPAGFDERSDLLFCGAVHEAGSPNYDSVIWFCNKVWPLVRQRLPGCRVRIAGYWAARVPLPAALQAEGVDHVGAVEDLRPLFATARVFVAPTRVAAGIPHKVEEAMALGVPAVVTPILAAQLRDATDGTGQPFFESADFSPGAFAAAVVTAYQVRPEWERRRADGLALIARRGDSKRFRVVLAQLAGEIDPHISVGN